MNGASEAVFCPFQSGLRAGGSRFKIAIPRAFLTCPLAQNVVQTRRREFQFLALEMIPDFYNKDALLLNYDTEEDLALESQYELHLHLTLQPNVFGKGLLELGREDAAGLSPFLYKVNAQSFNLKPQGLERGPFFLDWIDTARTAHLEQGETLNDLMRAEAESYYGMTLDANLHANKLPASYASVPGANGYLFPNNINVPLRETRLRVRLGVAPNTVVSFASKKMLENLGFLSESRSGLRRHPFENADANGFKYFVAESSPALQARMEAGKIYVKPAAETLFASSQLSLTGPDKRSNETLLQKTKALFKDWAETTNVDLDLGFNTGTKTFNLIWPANAQVHLRLTGDPTLFEILGFGLVKSVDPTSTVEAFSVHAKETATKTQILCYDTGQIIVTCPNVASNLASISSNQYMTSLFPQSSGKMEMPLHLGNRVVPPAFESGEDDTVPLECRLWKFNDNGVRVPFKWVCGAVVSGILMGKVEK